MKRAFVILFVILSAASAAATVDTKESRNGEKHKQCGEAYATDCKGKRCTFSCAKLHLEDSDSIELTVEDGGRKIKCHHKATKNKKNKKVWYGECDGDAEGANFVRRKNKDGRERVYGSVQVGADICKIATNGDDEEIECIPIADFPDEGGASAEEERATRDNDNIVGNLRTPKLFSEEEAAATRDAPNIFSKDKKKGSIRGNTKDDNGGTLDVMVLWTNEAECVNAGLSKGCIRTDATEEKMRGLIDLAVSETNTAFELSGVDTEFRLVHAYRDHKYAETPGGTKSPLINVLRDLSGASASGPHFADVNEKRRLYGADFVSIILADTSFCGTAYLGPTGPRSAVSATSYMCATGYFSFGHELAHNLGADHDRGTANQCNSKGYNYGWRDPNAEFRSILAYNCQPNQCDDMPKRNCPRVQRFSNPNHVYNGKAIGSATADNARTITEGSVIAASFYKAWDCSSDSDCYDTVTAVSGSCVIESRVCEFPPLSKEPSYFMESMVVPGVKSGSWTRVTLTETYVSPIVVCSVQYNGTGYDVLPAVVRMRRVKAATFAIALQNPRNRKLSGRTVYCVAVEEGSWMLPDGRKLEARSYLSTRTDRQGSWVGQPQTYSNRYTAPVVLGQVMTNNDRRWSVFWCQGSTPDAPPSPADLTTGKHVAGDFVTVRADEKVGFIVIETGHATYGGVEIEAALGRDKVIGFVQGVKHYKFNAAFSEKPAVAIVSQAGMDGTNGSWAVSSSMTRSSLKVGVDEDQIGTVERRHKREHVNYLVLSAKSSAELTPL